jgi:hypothetical protein
VRLLDTRATVLYEELTEQDDVTPRQFGVLAVLRQRTLADSQVTAKAGGRPMCGTASINSRV